MKIKKITEKQVKDAVLSLWEAKCGCYHYPLYTNRYGWEYDLVIGWHDVGDNYDPADYRYFDNGMALAWKIGIQSSCNGMQTDMDIDFDMPYDKETGEVYDTLEYVCGIWKEALKLEVTEINKVANEVIKFCEEDPEGANYTPGAPSFDTKFFKPIEVKFRWEDLWSAQDQSTEKLSENAAKRLFAENRDFLESRLNELFTEECETLIDEYLRGENQ